MAFLKEDIAALRERARLDEIVGEYVTLRPGGVDSLKGLCPFHDERTPSFHVRPSLGYFHCFGCGQGGDVIAFVEKYHHLSFPDAVQWLADKVGMQVRDDGAGRRRGEQEEPGRRQRLVEANSVAREFFTAQLDSPEAEVARAFLTERGFAPDSWERFSLGYAPRGWDNMLKALRGRGMTDAELLAAGLVSQGNRGVYDRFRGRLIWPIKDVTGTVVGFGARRLYEEDNGPKYLNTPETALYKKAQVLYGIDLARKEIAARRQVVVVEGYTDVMACHLAGIPTAVATCGTAFGDDHVRIVRRLLGDVDGAAAGVSFASQVSRGGEVVFTFDGDAAGQKAALRAFDADQKFAAQTFVAVEPGGLDPCDVRQQRGDAALRALLETREPLFRFAIRVALQAQDLSTPEGRVAGLRAAAPVVARIRDEALRGEYARELSGWLGMDEREVRYAVSRAGRPGVTVQGQGREQGVARGPSDPVVKLEREALEVVLQLPQVAAELGFDLLEPDTFLVPAHRAVHEAIRAAGGAAGGIEQGTASWLESMLSATPAELASLISGLAVAPLPAASKEAELPYAQGVLLSLLRLTVTRRIGELRAELGRLPEGSEEASAVFAQLVALERSKRELGPE